MTRKPPAALDEQSARSRYPGTRPFSDSADDYARFFGRNEEGEQLYLRVLSVPLLVHFGKSGLGKTSLLQAWLFPRLRQKPFLPVMVRLNVAEDTLTLAVARSIQQACDAEGLDYTPGRTDGLWELLSTTTVWRDDLLLTPVLVFDQFEEVFTLRDAAFRADLAAEFGALTSGNAPGRLHAGQSGATEQFAGRPTVKIVISLREDYLGALQEFSAAIPSLFHERLRLEPLTEEAARMAIVEPAQLAAAAGEEPYWAPRFNFEPSALDSMIGYLKGSSGVIEPFQLQLLCRHAEVIAYGKAVPQEAPIELTLADLNGSQGFASVLNNFYRDTLRKLPRSQRKKAEALCEEGLLGASGHRLMLEESQIRGDFGVEAETLATLSQERLVRREKRLESVFYEISHDRLADSIFASRRFRLPANVKRAFWAAGVAALLLVGGLVLWNRTVQRAYGRAEDLLSFLLGEDFLGKVRDVGDSTLLEQVQRRVEKYAGGDDQGSALNRGRALRNAGDIKRTRGFLKDSVILFEQALKAIESSPHNRDSRREAARSHERLAEALSTQGRVNQALSHYKAAEDAWRQVIAGPNDLATVTVDCISLAGSLVAAGELKYSMGEATLALKDVEEALKITSNVLFGRRTARDKCGPAADKTEPYPNAEALAIHSQAALVLARIFDFPEDYEGAAALAMGARWLRPPSMSARRNALVALALRGNGRMAASPQRALTDYRQALTDFEELRRWDPNNRQWQRERTAVQLLISSWIVTCHARQTKDCEPASALEEAAAMNVEAIATLRAMAQIDPSNVSLQTDLGWALQEYANVLAAQGWKTERLAILEKSEQVCRNSQSKNAGAESVAALGSILRDKAEALAALGRPHEAQAALQNSIELFKGLRAAHQDAPVYVAQLSAARRSEAEIRRQAGDTAGAAAADREAERLDKEYRGPYETLIGKRKEKADALSLAHVNEGAELFNEGDYAAALREFNSGLSATREAMLLWPADFRMYDNLRNNYAWIQVTQKKLGRAEERLAPITAELHAAKIAAWLAPEDSQGEMKANFLGPLKDLSLFLYRDGRLDEAQATIGLAEVETQGAALDPEYLKNLGDVKCGLGMIRRDRKKDGWEEAVRIGLIDLEKAAAIEKKEPDYSNMVGLWRRYLAEQLDAVGRKEEARLEYQLALGAYQETIRRAPGDKEAEEAIRGLLKLGIR